MGCPHRTGQGRRKVTCRKRTGQPDGQTASRASLVVAAPSRGEDESRPMSQRAGLPIMFINHLDGNEKSALIKFINDPKLSKGVNSRSDGFIR